MCDYDISVAVPLTDPWSSMILWMVVRLQMRNATKISRERPSFFAPAVDGAESVWEQWKIHLDIACLCGGKQSAKHNAWKLYTWFKFSVTVHWRNIAKYIGLENTTLERFSWRVQSDSDGGPPQYLENKKCVSTSHMRRDASWMHRDTRHIHS